MGALEGVVELALCLVDLILLKRKYSLVVGL